MSPDGNVNVIHTAYRFLYSWYKKARYSFGCFKLFSSTNSVKNVQHELCLDYK